VATGQEGLKTPLRYNAALFDGRSLVYFVQLEGGGPVKLGFTETLSQRYITLQEANPTRLVLLGVVCVRDREAAAALEAELKRRFAK